MRENIVLSMEQCEGKLATVKRFKTCMTFRAFLQSESRKCGLYVTYTELYNTEGEVSRLPSFFLLFLRNNCFWNIL